MHFPSVLNTPAYIYDLEVLEKTLNAAKFQASRFCYQIHYAVKANHNPVILSLIRTAGFGTDCVSGNEVLASLEAGFDSSKIVFAGVGKTDREIEQAISRDIACLNCESLEELQVIATIAAKRNKQARIALRINPDIEANTHKNIATGKEEDKFGIQPTQLAEALNFCDRNPFLKFVGLHFHIGSQIQSFEPFMELCKKASKIWGNYDIHSHGGKILNLGGGLGIDYANPVKNPIPPFREFFETIDQFLDLPDDVEIHFEFGRSLVGQCGNLLTRVLYVKEGLHKRHIITDAGMTELLRPALYSSIHLIENISSPHNSSFLYDVAGPVCESTDHFARNIMLPETKRGDMLVIRSCGAYAESMNLRYIMRDPPAIHFIRNGFFLPAAEINQQLNDGHDHFPGQQHESILAF